MMEIKKNAPEKNTLPEQRERIIRIKRIFILDEDGIFKEFFPERIFAPFSNFLRWEERKSFLLKGEVPGKIEDIIRKIQNTTVKKGQNVLRISVDMQKSIWGIDIKCKVYKEIKAKREEPKESNKGKNSSTKKEKGELVIFMTQSRPRITIITERDIYGDEKILNFFIAEKKRNIHDRR